MSGVDRQSIAQMVEDHVRKSVHRLGHTGWKMALAVSVCLNLLLVAGYLSTYLNDSYFRAWANAALPQAVNFTLFGGAVLGILAVVATGFIDLVKLTREKRKAAIVEEVLRQLGAV